MKKNNILKIIVGITCILLALFCGIIGFYYLKVKPELARRQGINSEDNVAITKAPVEKTSSSKTLEINKVIEFDVPDKEEATSDAVVKLEKVKSAISDIVEQKVDLKDKEINEKVDAVKEIVLVKKPLDEVQQMPVITKPAVEINALPAPAVIQVESQIIPEVSKIVAPDEIMMQEVDVLAGQELVDSKKVSELKPAVAKIIDQRRDGTLWYDSESSKWIITLGLSNGIEVGSSFNVYDNTKILGKVKVVEVYDVISYVEPVNFSSSNLIGQYLNVVLE